MGTLPFWDSGVAAESTLSNGQGDKLRTINQKFSDHPWDIAFIGGRPLPGICEVMDGLTEIGIDNKNPDGKDGNHLTLKGYRPGPFIISCTVWTAEQWSELQDVIDHVWRRPKKKTRVAQVAQTVHHPSLDLYGINSGALVGCTFPRPGAFEGAKVVSFKFIENTPSNGKKVTKTVGLPNVNKEVANRSAPKDGTPTPPSKNREKLGPKGPKADPT